MNREYIAKLPTPETRAHFDRIRDLVCEARSASWATFCVELEQRLAAAVMALNDCLQLWMADADPAECEAYPAARETLAAIRGDK